MGEYKGEYEAMYTVNYTGVSWLDKLQEVEPVSEVLAGFLVDGLPHQEGQLVGILAGGGDTHCALRGGEREGGRK